MDESLGYVSFGRQEPRLLAGGAGGPPAIDASEATRQRIDEAVRNIVMQALELATATLAVNRSVLERCARALLECETLEEAALDELTAGLQTAPADASTTTEGRPPQEAKRDKQVAGAT
jgi:cell division protease FtsH